MPNNATFEEQYTFYYHTDHLNSSNFVTDYEGREYLHYEYTAYGETWIEESQDTLKFIHNFYTGQMLDEETGLYCFQQRYLDVAASRWLSADPVYDGLKNGMSIYGYAYNNPLVYHDPTGLASDYYSDLLTKKKSDEETHKKNFQNGVQNSANYTLRGIKGEGSDKVLKNQTSDIGEPKENNKFCVYTTAFNAYSTKFNEDKGYAPNKADSIAVKEKAIKEGIISSIGRVNSHEKLAGLFNSYFNTNYKYVKGPHTVSNSLPDNFTGPNIAKDSVVMPYVTFDYSGIAHTSNYLGNNTVNDVYDDAVKDITNITIYGYGTHAYSNE